MVQHVNTRDEVQVVSALLHGEAVQGGQVGSTRWSGRQWRVADEAIQVVKNGSTVSRSTGITYC